MPAGTGVCVVKTVPPRTACSASAKDSPCDSVSSRIRSIALEAGVTLVGVEHLGLRGAGELAVRPQRAHPADTQQHLLAQPVVLAAAVEPVGDHPLGRGVLLDVAVQQQQ